jgi:hypothetical protein
MPCPLLQIHLVCFLSLLGFNEAFARSDPPFVRGLRNHPHPNLLRVQTNGEDVVLHQAQQHNNNNKLLQLEYVAETKLPTDIGQFQLRAYRIPGAPLGQEPCVIYSKDHPLVYGGTSVPVRIHDQCLTSEVFRSQRYVLIGLY